jgi:nucleolar protein 56
VKAGFVHDADEFNVWMRNVAMETTKLRVKGAVEKRDLVVAQAIQTLDELDKTINMLMARVREWYGIHFPELDRLLEKHETYARLVVELGSKDNFSLENLEKQDIPKAKAEGISKVAGKSMGADLEEADLKQIQLLCKDLLSMYQLRESLEKYMDSTMAEVAPNIKHLLGSLLGARLIAVAGGLMNLAKRPASTIQVLGAEKALFRSLKTGSRPPKHGMIFQHTLLHDAKRWQRGKIARALAGKVAIGARADAFGGRYIGDDLKADLDRRIEEIRQKYDQPPPLRPPKPQPERPRNEFSRHDRKWRKHRRER